VPLLTLRGGGEGRDRGGPSMDMSAFVAGGVTPSLFRMRKRWPPLWRAYRASLARCHLRGSRSQRRVTAYVSAYRGKAPVWYLYN
jgi:hypothetical protein